MKNNFKTYAKKSVSLFLAVLMVMSCWVWMAPEKAEAAEITPKEKYSVEIDVNIDNWPNEGGDVKATYVKNNGKGTSVTETVISSIGASDQLNGGSGTLKFTVNGFPTSITIVFKTGWDTSKGQVKAVRINGYTVASNNWGWERTSNMAWTREDIFTLTPNAAGTDGTDNCTGGTWNWPAPKIVGFVDSTASGTAQSISINKIGGTEVNKTTSFSYGTCYDQYDVKWTGTTDLSSLTKSVWISKTEGGSDMGDSNIYYDAEKGVVIKPELQITQVADANGEFECYLIESYTGKNIEGGEVTSKVSAKYTITFPKYSIKFDAQLDDAKITAGDEIVTGTYVSSNYHTKNIVPPSKTELDGYTFMGYWTTRQPSSGDASYNAKEADYAMPCSTDDYNSYEKAIGSTVEGNIVIDAEGNRWYDAGIEFDAAVHKMVDITNDINRDKEGNLITEDDMITNWFGWWIADDITVKFYDVDGTYLGEQTVKNGQDHKAITWPKSKYINSGYTSGAFKYKIDSNMWVNINGDEVKTNSHKFSSATTYFLTPKLVQESFDKTYSISFIDPFNRNSLAVGGQGGIYDYRQNISSIATEATNRIASNPPVAFEGDTQYSYEFIGWSSLTPSVTGQKYHVVQEYSDLDVNRNPIGINDDWTVRSNATYYAVYRRHAKTYVVEFIYTDATGKEASAFVDVKYGEKLVPPTNVVPYEYVVEGYGSKFDKWLYAGPTGDATLDYSKELLFTSENIAIYGSALKELEGTSGFLPLAIYATYGTPAPTPYTITFSYVDKEGSAVSVSDVVRNKDYIKPSTVSQLKPAATWDYEDQLYTYADKWEITEGAVKTRDGKTKTVGEKIDTKDLVNLSPISNVNLKAVYADPEPFYTVTYVDGTNTWSDRVLKDSAVPAWIVDGKEYKPADYKGEGGTFVFAGWFDQAQLDADRIETNGKQYTTADTVTSDLTLYSQFKFVPDTFRIEFWNHDHSVQLGAGDYVKGQNIEEMVSIATRAARARDKDETYEYTFIGWDKPVPTECEGRAMSFTALYKREYRYYDAKWYNSVLDEDGNWVADKTTETVDGKVVEKYLLATTHHTYNSKINLPSVKVVCQETPDDNTQSYVFAGWNYVIRDKDGKVTESGKYERGMKITSEMEFFATFTLSPKTFTVTTIVKGETETYTAATGSKITDIISDPKAGYVAPTYVAAENGNYDLVEGKYVQVEAGTGSYNIEKASCHDAFAGWYTDAECKTKVADDAVITSDMTLYAKFEESAHDYTESKTTKAPTYYENGEKTEWCVCNAEETSRTAEIPMLTDSVAPTGTIYLGGLGKWSSTDAVGGAALDKNEDGTAKEITLYANANTDVIITANDTGDVDDEFNPSGLGKGVKYIRAFVYPGKFTTLTSTSYGAAQSLAMDVYVDETQAQNNNANFSVKLGDFVVAEFDENGNVVMEDGKVKSTDLKSGESYIVYYYVVDKAGKQLNSKVRTAKFWYDAVAPEFDIEGTSDEAYIPTYCGTATVTGFEEEANLTVNSKPATLTDGKLVISAKDYKDNVVITATDKAGNTYSKKIKVADHKWDEETVAATCTTPGYTQAECIICDAVKDREDIPATGHGKVDDETAEWIVTKEADCITDGEKALKCLKCNETIDTETIVSEGHKFAKDTEGNDIYKVITESTCITEGTKEARCTVCNGDLNGGLKTESLPINEENHEKITVDEEAADCTHDGWYKETCICGAVLVDKNATTDPDIYKATGHTEVWEVRTPANCYTDGLEVLRCSECLNYITDDDNKEVTRVIPATGEHVKVVSNPDSYKEDKEIRYQCATPGCPEVYKPVPYVDQTLKSFTVTFKAEDGTELSTTTVAEGSYVSDDGVIVPVKEATESVRYTFAGWVANGKVAKFPYAVTEDVTFTASYKSTTIKYKHIFQVPTTITEEDGKLVYGGARNYETLIGTYGQETKYSGEPALKLAASDTDYNELYTFKFKGWKDTAGNVVNDFTVKGDATFVAYYEETAIIHKVSFYNGTNLLKQVTDVVAGTTGIVYTGETPVKNFDNEYHYTFNGWYTDSTCKTPYDPDEGIVSDLQIYAGFTKTEHGNYDVALDENGKEIITKKASCGVNEEKQFKCGNCGHTKVEVIANSALEHDWSGTPEYDKVTGNNVITCKNGCGKTKTEKIVVKVTFKDYDKTALSTVEYKIGEEITYNVIPERDEDVAKTYTFDGWKLENDTSDKIYHNGEFGVITADSLDMVFIACYTETAKMYKVSYLPANSEVALYTVEVKYGSTLPEYVGSTDRQAIFGDDYLNQYDDYGHIIFAKWDKDATYIVKGDVDVRPITKVDTETGHTWIYDEVKPTCTEDGGKVTMCQYCAYRDVESDRVPALDHDWDDGEITTKPNYETQTPGEITYHCKRKDCSETKTETIDGNKYSIKATVKDANGNPKANVRVELLKKNEAGSYELYMPKNTGADGVVIFGPLEKGEYRVYVPETNTYYNATVEEDGTVSGSDITVQPENKPVDNSCKCSCHKENFWGIIYRLIQKIIKFFTGKPSCCACPDKRI